MHNYNAVIPVIFPVLCRLSLEFIKPLGNPFFFYLILFRGGDVTLHNVIAICMDVYGV
jgi:hypothetical protein